MLTASAQVACSTSPVASLSATTSARGITMGSAITLQCMSNGCGQIVSSSLLRLELAHRIDRIYLLEFWLLMAQFIFKELSVTAV